MWTKLKSILSFKSSKVNPPEYTGPHAEIWAALDYNLQAGQLVVAI